MVVVVDAGPLIHLSWVSHLDLLPTLYGRVLAPHAVWVEVIERGEGRFGIDALRDVKWLDVRPDPEPSWTAMVVMHIDAGERAAIALAQEVEAELLLCDDRQGRRIGRAAGLRVIGTLGILLQARLTGNVDGLAPLTDRLVAEGFFVSRDVVDALLHAAGER